jgi:ATP-dependent Clp protease ATP-binding subunit ClpA
MAAEEVGASLLRIAAPGWLPVGAHNRGSRETITVIAAHVATHDRTILVIDEIDKIVSGVGGTGSGSDNWQSYIRGEIYDLIDARWPTGLKDADGNEMTADATEELTTKLRETVLVLGIGTFQSWFDSANSRRSMGFGAEIAPENDELTADIIAEKMPRELANRFNSTLIRLPELSADDYHRIAAEATYKLPQRMQEAFGMEVSKRILGAIAAKKGVRFLEEAMMEVLKNLPHEPVSKTQNAGKIKIPPRPNLDTSTP